MQRNETEWELMSTNGIRRNLLDIPDARQRARELSRLVAEQQALLTDLARLRRETIAELRAAIAKACQHVEERSGKEWFRLAIDRSFIVQGHGTVVTGSVTSGSVKVGDEVDWLPRSERVRQKSGEEARWTKFHYPSRRNHACQQIRSIRHPLKNTRVIFVTPWILS